MHFHKEYRKGSSQFLTRRGLTRAVSHTLLCTLPWPGFIFSHSIHCVSSFIDDETGSERGVTQPFGAECFEAGLGSRTDSSHILLSVSPDGPERVALERGSGSPPSTPNHPLSCLHTHKYPEDQDPL